MGTARRERPTRLPAKLRQIRDGLDLTQEQMAERLASVKSPPRPGHVSEFEQGKREPSLPVLLRYARAAGVPVEVLIDDEQDLPKHLPTEATWIMKHGQLWRERKKRSGEK
jgi:transcriptional regulator with XRE-family HTH domain